MKPNSPLLALLALASLGDYPGPRGQALAKSEALSKRDPNRPKTAHDLERMAAAQAKRDRKAARRAAR